MRVSLQSQHFSGYILHAENGFDPERNLYKLKGLSDQYGNPSLSTSLLRSSRVRSQEALSLLKQYGTQVSLATEGMLFQIPIRILFSQTGKKRQLQSAYIQSVWM